MAISAILALFKTVNPILCAVAFVMGVYVTNAFNNAGEYKRVTGEIERERAIHAQAMKSKSDEIAATSDALLELSSKLSKSYRDRSATQLQVIKRVKNNTDCIIGGDTIRLLNEARDGLYQASEPTSIFNDKE